MSINSFMPTANTCGITANVTAPSAVQIPSNGSTQYVINNNGNVTVALGYGTNSNAATNGAAFPSGVGANTTACLILEPGSVQTYTLPPNVYVTGATASGTANVYIMPGEGQ